MLDLVVDREILSRRLPNGVRVVVRSARSALVAVQAWVRVGSSDEGLEEAGMAHFLEHLNFRRDAEDHDESASSEIAWAGGRVNAFTTQDHTVFHAVVAKEEVLAGVDVLAGVVRGRAFEPAMIETERRVVLAEIARAADRPAWTMHAGLLGALFAEHPYGRPVLGTPETVGAFTPDGVVGFRARGYTPATLTVVVVGDVGEDEAFGAVAAGFGDWDVAVHERVASARKAPLALPGRVVSRESRARETQFVLGWRGAPYATDDAACLDLLTVLLGGGESSRLPRIVKRDEGRAFSCYANHLRMMDSSVVALGATVGPLGDVCDALAAVLDEARKLGREPTPATELAKAKRFVLSRSVYQRETMQGWARRLGQTFAMGADETYERAWYRAIERQRPEDVMMFAARFFRADAAVVSVVHPGSAPDLTRVLVDDRARAPRMLAVAPSPSPSPSVKGGSERREASPCASTAKVAKIVVVEDRSLGILAVSAAVQGGLLSERPEQNGVTYLLSRLLVRGTGTRTGHEIADALDAMAGRIEGIPGRNSLGLTGTFLREKSDEALELFASCLFDSALDAGEIAREKRLQLQGIGGQRDTPSSLCLQELWRCLWSRHPYRMSILGAEASVASLDREALVAHYEAQIAPARLSIAIVGDVDANAARDLLESKLARCERTWRAAPPLPDVEQALSAPQEVHTVRDIGQVHAAFGFRGVDLADERRHALAVLTRALGGQGGRLYASLRERSGLVYSVTADSLEGVHPGHFMIYLATSPAKFAQVRSRVMEELDRVRRDGLTPSELERARRALVGTHRIRMQRRVARAITTAVNAACGLDPEEHRLWESHLERVTEEDVRRVAREILDPARMVSSIVGPAS